MRRFRWSDTVALLLSVVIVAGLGYALRPQRTATIAADPAAVSIERPRTEPHDAPSALFITDSYTSGTGLKERYFGCIAAVSLGWLCDLSAEPGTGYISGGEANRFVDRDLGPSSSFSERLPKLATTYRPDFVVLDGARNDRFAPVDAVFDVMSATISGVRRTWPNAKVVVIRPRELDRPGDDLGYDDEFFGRLLDQAGTPDVTVLDPIGALAQTDTSGLVTGDGTRPNQQGVDVLASALGDSLRNNGFAAPPSS